VGKDYASGLYGSNYQGPGVNANTDRLIWRKEVEAGRSLESF
jgi:hypothetical protein